MDSLESSTVFPISSVADIFIFQYGGTGEVETAKMEKSKSVRTF
jgi:hypothetical protein